MATESTTPPLHTPTPTPAATTVTAETPTDITRIEEEKVLVAKQGEVGEEVACEQKLLSKPEGEAEDKQIESAEVQVKVVEEEFAKLEEHPATASADEREQEQPNVVNVPESSIDTVEKPKEISEILPTKESEQVIVKDSLQVPEQVDIPEADVKLKEQSVEEIGKPVKESETVVEDTEKSEAESNDVDKQEEPKEPEQVESIGKQQESSQSGGVKEEPAEYKDGDKPEPAKEEHAESKDGDKPEPKVAEIEVKPEDEYQVTDKVEINLTDERTEAVVPVEVKPEEQFLEIKVQNPKLPDPEEEVKPKEEPQVTDKVEINLTDERTEAVVPVEVKPEEQSLEIKEVQNPKLPDPEEEEKPKKEPQVTEKLELKSADEKTEPVVADVEVKPEEQSAVNKEVEKPKLPDPEVEINSTDENTEAVVPQVEVKPEEQSLIVKEVDKPVLPYTEVEVKPKEESQVAEKVEIKSTDEKTEPVVADIKGENVVAGKIELKESTNSETVINEVILANKVEDSTVVTEDRTSKEEEASATPEQVALPEQEPQADLKEVEEKAGEEDGKKGNDGIDGVEVPLKGADVEREKGVEEKEENTNQTEGKNIETDVLNEELAQPIKADNDISKDNINCQVLERLFEGEKTDKDVDPVRENKKEESPALVKTSKDLEEDTAAVTEPKEKESEKTGEEALEKKNMEEKAKSTKDDDGKTSEGQPKEIPAKVAQKQSNNILSKVKQSLVKAKKAIIGKSPSSKALTSDAKGDIKVK